MSQGFPKLCKAIYINEFGVYMPLSDPSFLAAEDLDREISNMSTVI